MNDKKCKALRRMARDRTVGRADKQYLQDKYGTVRLEPSCTRAYYQRAKRSLSNV